MTLQVLIQAKKKGKKWVMLTASDAPTAEILEVAGVDWILVGDSLGMVVLGYDSLAAYVKRNPMFGALVGRYSGRIAKAKFTLNGVEYQLARNSGGCLSSLARFRLCCRSNYCRNHCGFIRPQICNFSRRRNYGLLGNNCCHSHE